MVAQGGEDMDLLLKSSLCNREHQSFSGTFEVLEPIRDNPTSSVVGLSAMMRPRLQIVGTRHRKPSLPSNLNYLRQRAVVKLVVFRNLSVLLPNKASQTFSLWLPIEAAVSRRPLPSSTQPLLLAQAVRCSTQLFSVRAYCGPDMRD